MDDILDQITTPEQLGLLIDNLSPEDLTLAVGAVGGDAILQRVCQAMEERFRPERAGAASGVALFRVTVPDGAVHQWHLTVDSGTASAARGVAANPTATFSAGLTDFLRLAAGRLNALQGVTAKHLDVRGDLRFAARLMGWFDLGSGTADPMAATLASIRTPGQLAALLDDRSDHDINDFAAAVGAEAILEQVFREMERRFLPEKATGRSAVIQWRINGPDGTRHEWHLKVDDGTCVATQGKADAAQVTLGFTLPNFLKLAANQLNGVQGVMTGRIKVSGNLMLGAAMEGWFARQ